MKRCSLSLDITEIQMKTTMQIRYHYSYIRNTEIKKKKKRTVPNVGEDMEEPEPSCAASGVEDWHSCFGRQFGNFQCQLDSLE